VKVDPKLFLGDNGDKENAQPLQLHKQGEEEAQQKFADARRKQAEEAAKRRKEEEAAAAARQQQEHLRREAQKAAELKARQESEEKRREEDAAVAKMAAAAAAAAAEVQRLRQEVQRAAEEQAQREREAAELVSAQGKVNEWCKSHGFHDLKTQKKTYMGARKFPLHTAVKHKQEEMVGLLLKCGADKLAKDSRKQTPSELAANMNKNGSHDQILALLL